MATVEAVVTGFALEGVAAFTAVEAVVACASAELVGTLATLHHIQSAGAGKAVVAVGAFNLDIGVELEQAGINLADLQVHCNRQAFESDQ